MPVESTRSNWAVWTPCHKRSRQYGTGSYLSMFPSYSIEEKCLDYLVSWELGKCRWAAACLARAAPIQASPDSKEHDSIYPTLPQLRRVVWPTFRSTATRA